MKTAAIIVAAGRGMRAGGDVPKQWQVINGRLVIEYTLSVFVQHPRVDEIILVVSQADLEMVEMLKLSADIKIAIGGAERSASVQSGLAVAQADQVLIHDGARCCVSPAVIDRVLGALVDRPAVAPAIAVTDALWTGHVGYVTGVQNRDGLFRAQTPQGFHLSVIRDAHELYGAGSADDVEVARRAGLGVTIVDGDEANLKITTPIDFTRAAAILRSGLEDRMDIRTGNGFDVHRFGEGDHVTLCGCLLYTSPSPRDS